MQQGVWHQGPGRLNGRAVPNCPVADGHTVRPCGTDLKSHWCQSKWCRGLSRANANLHSCKDTIFQAFANSNDKHLIQTTRLRWWSSLCSVIMVIAVNLYSQRGYCREAICLASHGFTTSHTCVFVMPYHALCRRRLWEYLNSLPQLLATSTFSCTLASASSRSRLRRICSAEHRLLEKLMLNDL